MSMELLLVVTLIPFLMVIALLLFMRRRMMLRLESRGPDRGPDKVVFNLTASTCVRGTTSEATSKRNFDRMKQTVEHSSRCEVQPATGHQIPWHNKLTG